MWWEFSQWVADIHLLYTKYLVCGVCCTCPSTFWVEGWKFEPIASSSGADLIAELLFVWIKCRWVFYPWLLVEDIQRFFWTLKTLEVAGCWRNQLLLFFLPTAWLEISHACEMYCSGARTRGVTVCARSTKPALECSSFKEEREWLQPTIFIHFTESTACGSVLKLQVIWILGGYPSQPCNILRGTVCEYFGYSNR